MTRYDITDEDDRLILRAKFEKYCREFYGITNFNRSYYKPNSYESREVQGMWAGFTMGAIIVDGGEPEIKKS